MRLTQRQQSVINDVAAETFGPDAKVRFLATLEIARRELALLDDSHTKLFALTIDARWARQLRHDIEDAETLEAFVGRLQDTVGSKLIPRALTILLEKPGSMLDNLSRAEQLGWTMDTEAWIIAQREPPACA